MTRSPPPGLRPYLPTDAPLLAALFRASIETLAEDYYSEDQLAAWASVADDEAAFAARLASPLTIVALQSGEIVGFATLENKGVFAMLYVHPAQARQGVGSALADAIEKLAAARGVEVLTADVSDAGRDFFTALGYEAQRRNMVAINDEWLGNTTMTKALAPAQKRPQ